MKFDAEHSYLGSRMSHLQSRDALGHAIVYSNQDLQPVMASFKAEIDAKNAEIAAGQTQAKNQLISAA